MDNRGAVRDFLTSRRARITPDQAGLSSFGIRRVPGLRRAEVAQLAGVSTEYYTRLERGNLSGVSESVLDALASGLQLDESERSYLLDLARAASSPVSRRSAARPVLTGLRPSLQRLLDSMVGIPAFIRNGRLDILGINSMGRALYSLAYEQPRRPVNLARFVFFDPRAHLLHPDWSDSARTTVSILRSEAGRHPYDKALSDLIGELSTRSEEFRVRWAAHNVRLHRTGSKHFRHPGVGDLNLMFDALDVPGDSGWTLTAYSAAPGTTDADNLALLASWAATNLPATTTTTTRGHRAVPAAAAPTGDRTDADDI